MNHGVGKIYQQIRWNLEKKNGYINEDYNTLKHSKSKDIGGIAVVIPSLN
jgi:hypothetical protein